MFNCKLQFVIDFFSASKSFESKNDSYQYLTELSSGYCEVGQENHPARRTGLLLSIHQEGHPVSAAHQSDFRGSLRFILLGLLWSALSDELPGRSAGRSVQRQREE